MWVPLRFTSWKCLNIEAPGLDSQTYCLPLCSSVYSFMKRDTKLIVVPLQIDYILSELLVQT